MSERTWTNVRLEKDELNDGRWNVFARLEDGEDWVQVESILGLEYAEKHADRLEEDDEYRAEAIEEDNFGEDEDEDDEIENSDDS